MNELLTSNVLFVRLILLVNIFLVNVKFPFDKSVDTVALLSDIGKDILSVLDPKIYSPSISKGSKELIVYP